MYRWGGSKEVRRNNREDMKREKDEGRHEGKQTEKGAMSIGQKMMSH